MFGDTYLSSFFGFFDYGLKENIFRDWLTVSPAVHIVYYKIKSYR